MSDAATIATISSVVKTLGGDAPNLEAAIAAFKGQNVEAKIVQTLILADDTGKLVGLFVPPVAVIANDVGIAIEIEQILEPILEPLVMPFLEKLAKPLVVWLSNKAVVEAIPASPAK